MKHDFTTAQWIWHKGSTGVNETVDFYAEFTADPGAQYEILLSVNSHYALYINGEFLEADQFQDYTFYKVYDRMPLPVMAGKNTLQILAYCQGDSSSTVRPSPGGVIYEVYCDGESVLASGTDTLCRRNKKYKSDGVEKVTSQLSYSFRYDAAAGDNAWEAAYVCAHEWPLHERPVKKLVIEEPMQALLTVQGSFYEKKMEGTVAQRMQAAAITAGAPVFRPILPSVEGVVVDGNFALIDLTKEVVGYFYLDIELPEACDIHIGWGEHIEDLRVRTEVGPRNFGALYHGYAGRNRFFYPIKKMGLRYVQLHVHTENFKLYYAGVRPTRYPYEKVNLFTCADHLHAQIYRTCMRTLQGCMHEHYEDCPWREQALYAMDSRNQMLIGYYTFEEYEFAKASLRLMALSIRKDHLLELMSPGEWPEHTIPSFSLYFLIQMGEYLRYSGDVEFVKEVLPVACEVAEEFVGRIQENGLVLNFEGSQYWNFFEWEKGLDGMKDGGMWSEPGEYSAPLSALTILGLVQLAYMCRAVGDATMRISAGNKADAVAVTGDAAADRYERCAATLRNAFHKGFWQEDKGYYATYLGKAGLHHACELTQSYALACGAVPEEKVKQVRETLTGHMGEEFIPVTLSTGIFKYEVLLQDSETYGRFVFDQVAEIFGGMLYKGATTFWETEDGASAFDNAGSLCHAWAAVPAYLYMRYCVDSKQEGTKLPERLTGIYEPGVKEYGDASHNILWDRF